MLDVTEDILPFESPRYECPRGASVEIVRKCALCTLLICINACICMRAIVRTFVSVGARARALGEEQSRSANTREARAPEVAAPRRHSSRLRAQLMYSIFHYRQCASCGRPNYLSPRETDWSVGTI